MSVSLQPAPNQKGKNSSYSESEREHYITEYLNSDLSVPAFCDKHGLAYSTFHGWLAKKKTQEQVASFIPVEVKRNVVEPSPPQSIEVIHKRIKVHVPAITDIDAIIKLIRGLA